MNEKWEKGLETILVEFHLIDRLAFAYEQKLLDQEVTDLEGERPTNLMVRRVSGTFGSAMRSFLTMKIVRLLNQ
jgi:hypothetical protein